MTTPRKLDFSGETSPTSQSLSRRKSLRKHPLESPASSQTKKKMNMTKFHRIWNEEDEITVLKGLVDFRAQTGGLRPNRDSDAFYGFLGGSIVEKFSKDQLSSKIRKLKGKFLNQKTHPGSDAFVYSSMIWGKHEPESAANGSMDNAPQSKDGEENEEASLDNAQQSNDGEENDEATNGEPLTENQEENEEAANVEPLTENETQQRQSKDDTDADELRAVGDAFETMISKGLSSDYSKKLELQKLMNLGPEKIKELGTEWKAICADEAKLNTDKLKFSAKLARAANS